MSASAGDLEHVPNPPGTTPLDDPTMIETMRFARSGRALCRVLLCAGAAMALAGCHHGLLREHSCYKPQPYASAQSIPPLKVPPGVDAPDTRGALLVPPLTEPTPPSRRASDPCLDEPPPFATPAPAPTKRVPGA